jgi:hypothetical protein
MTNNTESADAATANDVSAESPRARITRPSLPIDWGDFVISAALLAIFIAAFLNAREWQPIAALFPKLATGIGAVLSAAFLVRCVVTRREPPSAVPVAESATTDPVAAAREAEESGSDQAESDRTFFASVSRRDWLVSLTYFAAFFIGLYVLGLYVTSLVFTVVYLKFQARSSLKLSVIYAVVLTAALYGLFGYALQLPVPEGLFGLSAL